MSADHADDQILNSLYARPTKPRDIALATPRNVITLVDDLRCLLARAHALIELGARL